MSDEPQPASPDARNSENAIMPGRARGRKRADAPEAAPEREAASGPSKRLGDLPPAVAKRFFGEPAKSGAYIDYYEGAGAKHPSFRDRGGKLVALQTDPSTVAALVAIARHRNWETIQVQGDDDFRREVWREAQARGLSVQGYRPTARDREEQDQARDPRRETTSERQPRDAAEERPSRSAAVEGKLVEIGEAPYQNRKNVQPSPFIRVERADGEVKQLWGGGLPLALERSGAQVGDAVQVRRAGSEKVIIKVDERDPDTGRTIRREREVDRVRWEIDAQRFRDADPGQRMADPQLRGAQARLNFVEAITRDRLADPAARERIKAGAEARVADHLANGRPIAPPPGRERDGREQGESAPERVRGR